jgi:predicted RNA-binding protein Jag
MVVKEFEGKTEKEAIDRAIEELGLDRNEIDFEIVEAKRPGILFRGGKVKIRVHMSEESVEVEDGEEGGDGAVGAYGAQRALSARSALGAEGALGAARSARG